MKSLIERLKFDTKQIEILPSGYHTQVTLIVHNGEHFVVKIISKPAFSDPGVASALALDIQTYHRMLKQAGMRTPDISRIEILSSSAGSDLVIIAPFEGHDAERYLLGEFIPTEKVLDGILYSLDPLLASHRDCVLEIGIDPKPANFVSHDGNIYSYVDWMPPRFRKNGMPLVEYEPPKSEAGFRFAYWRSYNVVGVLSVLQSQLSRLLPMSRALIKARVLDYAASFTQSVVDALNQRPSETVFQTDVGTASNIIQGFSPEQLYELREIACELVFRQRAGADLVQEVFRLTHFFDDLPDSLVFERAKYLVLDAFQR